MWQLHVCGVFLFAIEKNYILDDFLHCAVESQRRVYKRARDENNERPEQKTVYSKGRHVMSSVRCDGSWHGQPIISDKLEEEEVWKKASLVHRPYLPRGISADKIFSTLTFSLRNKKQSFDYLITGFVLNTVIEKKCFVFFFKSNTLHWILYFK